MEPITDAATKFARLIAFDQNSDLPGWYQTEIYRELTGTHMPRNVKGSRSVLLVGGAGYIGTVVTDALLNAGYDVRVADAFVYGHEVCVYHLLSRANLSVVRSDFTDQNQYPAMLRDITDVVILGGLVGDPITKKYPDESNMINGDGISRLIDYVADLNLARVVFISTCSNYGLIGQDEKADEEFELNPLSLYAKAKVQQEEHLISYADKDNFTPTVLRFSTAFGLSPRMRFDLTVNQFTRELALGMDLMVFDAHTWRPYCHVQDFARVIRRVLESSTDRVRGQVFNAGGDVNNYTKQGIVDAILKLLPDARVAYKDHGDDPRNYRVSFQKIAETLLFEPSVTVEQGVEEILHAVRSGLFDYAEADKGFYGNYTLV